MVKRAGKKPTPKQKQAIEDQARATLKTAGQLSRTNRLMREALETIALREGHEVIPFQPPSNEDPDFTALFGTTIHAGEQVATARIDNLLGDIDVALDSGTDRIGHAVVLGIEINRANLEKLGFKWNAKGGRNKQGALVRGRESYTLADLGIMDGRRKALLERAALHGVSFEIPPTSNLVLNGLGITDHPIATMLRDAPKSPPLRISISTDNPGVHNIDVRSEMALLLATGAISWPQAVSFALEGFAARMGGRPIARADELARQMADKITSETRDTATRQTVLDKLKARWPDVAPPPGGWPSNLSEDAIFRELMRRFVERATQGRAGPAAGPEAK